MLCKASPGPELLYRDGISRAIPVLWDMHCYQMARNAMPLRDSDHRDSGKSRMERETAFEQPYRYLFGRKRKVWISSRGLRWQRWRIDRYP